MKRRHHLTLLCLAAFAASIALPAPASAQRNESYFFANGAIAGGNSTYVDKFAGQDMLPYTADDIDLPENGNTGGTWGFSWIDLDGDGVLDEEDRIFTVIRRDDDDIHSFVPQGFPKYGVLKEGENFIDYHDARNLGPSHDGTTCAAEEFPGCLGDDFEHNDRGGNANGVGQPGFESAQNFLWYNNYRADQRGWGGSKYYFALENGTGLDEMEGYLHWCTFQNNADDPETPEFDESGTCDRDYMRSPELVIKGLLIPVEDIAGLADGDLDPLFGWYDGDMATYVRDTLGPKLSDPSLTTTSNSEDCAMSETQVSPTHLMILQLECPIAINATANCADQAQAEAMAAYWGITPITPGEPETSAIYRVTNVLLFNDALTQVDEGTPNFITLPEDGVERNLWVQDSFARPDKNRIGRYVLGPAAANWSIQDDSSLDAGCGSLDHHLQLEAGTPGYFEAPLDATLNTGTAAVYGIADLGIRTLPAVDPLGAGGGIIAGDATFQIILLNGSTVVAYAEVAESASSVNIGGSLNADGLAVNPTTTMAGPGGVIPSVDPVIQFPTEYTRFALRVDGSSVKLLQAEAGDFTPADYEGLDDHDVLVSLASGVAGEVTAVRVATSGTEALSLAAPAADSFAVFQNLAPVLTGGRQKPGDENQDGNLDLSDPVAVLNYLFLGTNPSLPCGDGSNSDPANLAFLDANDDNKLDLSDPIALLSFLFLGAGPPVPCAGDITCPCIVVPNCPDNPNCP